MNESVRPGATGGGSRVSSLLRLAGRTLDSAIFEPTYVPLAFLLIAAAAIFGLGGLVADGAIRGEAVRRGAARWVVDDYGKACFEWNEPRKETP